jgi:hypothetical protein
MYDINKELEHIKLMKEYEIQKFTEREHELVEIINKT